MVAGRGKRLGKVSGVVFERPGYKTVYVAGDTTWNRYVEDAIARYRPDVMVVNACYGRLVGYDGSFIMGKEDLYRAYQALPKATVVASHMEALAHCTQTRKDLRDYIAEKGLDPQRVLVPEDGQSYAF
jgi:L-ascorbate metabolism protein UlaG (beta-lactamase superfamily)